MGLSTGIFVMLLIFLGIHIIFEIYDFRIDMHNEGKCIRCTRDKCQYEDCPHGLKPSEQEEIIEKTKHLEELFKSSRDGFVRGLIIGTITNSADGALAGGILYGIINPTTLVIQKYMDKQTD